MAEDPLNDLMRRRWRGLGDMPMSLGAHSVAAWDDNRAIITGGINNYGRPMNSVFVYDKRTNEFTALPPMLDHRCCHASAVSGNRLFVISGHVGFEYSNTIDVLDLNDPSEWRHLPVRLQVARSWFSAVVANEKIYLIGGLTADGVSASVEILDVANDSLSQGPALRVGRSSHAAAFVGVSIVVAGGTSQNNNSPRVFLQSGEQLLVSEAAPQWQPLGVNMNEQLVGAASVSFGDLMVVIGGKVGPEERVINTVTVWNGSTRRWIQLPAMLQTGRKSAAAIKLGDDIVIFGGFDSNDTELSSVECLFGQQSMYRHHQRYQPALLHELIADTEDEHWRYWHIILKGLGQRGWISHMYKCISERPDLLNPRYR